MHYVLNFGHFVCLDGNIQWSMTCYSFNIIHHEQMQCINVLILNKIR